jgi:hypothetical protein
MSEVITDDALDTESHIDKMLLGKTTETSVPEGKESAEPEEESATAATTSESTTEEPKPTAVVVATEEDALDSIKLGAHARPATTEAFTKVKELARQEIRKLREELETVRTSAKPAEPDESTTKELEELRNFRESVALEADPTFVERFDKRLTTIDEKIYSRLKEAGASDADITKIKEFGGVEKLDLDKLAPDPRLRRFIETKLVEKDEVTEQRKEAVAKGSDTRKKFLEERRQSYEQEGKKQTEERTTEFKRLATTLDPFKPIEVPKNASAEERKNIQEINTFVANKLTEVEGMVVKGSPKLQAELAAGYALAHVFLMERDGLSRKTEQLTKQLAEAQEKIKSFQDAGRTLRVDPRPTAPKTGPRTDLRSADAAMAEFFGDRK